MPYKDNGKTLYHIQNLNMCSDCEPFDAFVLCGHFPTKDDLRELYSREFPDNDSKLDEFLTSSNIYNVFVEEL